MEKEIEHYGHKNTFRGDAYNKQKEHFRPTDPTEYREKEVTHK